MARDRLKNPSINFPESREEARQAIIHKARRLLFDGEFGMNHVFTPDAGLGYARDQETADWLNEEQSLVAQVLENVLDMMDHSKLDETADV